MEQAALTEALLGRESVIPEEQAGLNEATTGGEAKTTDEQTDLTEISLGDEAAAEGQESAAEPPATGDSRGNIVIINLITPAEKITCCSSCVCGKLEIAEKLSDEEAAAYLNTGTNAHLIFGKADIKNRSSLILIGVALLCAVALVAIIAIENELKAIENSKAGDLDIHGSSKYGFDRITTHKLILNQSYEFNADKGDEFYLYGAKEEYQLNCSDCVTKESKGTIEGTICAYPIDCNISSANGLTMFSIVGEGHSASVTKNVSHSLR